MQLKWGKAGQLTFANEEEYYTALGIFANQELASVYVEDNAKRGSYTDAYRIQLRSEARGMELPDAVKRAMKNAGRINCNPYVENLMENHNFTISGSSITAEAGEVLQTIPKEKTEYIAAFMKGYNLFREGKSVEVKEVADRESGIDVSSARLVRKEPPKSVSGGPASEKPGSFEPVGQKQENDRPGGKKNYIASAIRDLEIGEAGEKIVYEHERQKLAEALRDGKIKELGDKLEWVSRRDDSAGYDIRSYDTDKKEPMYIEVKTTTGGVNAPFYMSDNEMKVSEKLGDNYYLYRLYSLNEKKPDQVEFFVLQGNIAHNPAVGVEKQNYKIVIKAQ